MQSLILFKPGTVDTKENIFLGWLNIPLNKKGLGEAKTVAKKLKKEKIDYAICFDQLRSKQAIVEVLKYHSKAKVIIDTRLRERNYGVFSGKSKEVLKKYFSSEKYDEIHRGHNANIPLGENLKDVSMRVYPFTTELLKFMAKEKANIVVCAGTNSLRFIEAYLENIPEEKVHEKELKPTEFKKYKLKLSSE